MINEEERNTVYFIPGSILEGPFWSEPIKVISCRQVGTSIEIYGVGVSGSICYTPYQNIHTSV